MANDKPQTFARLVEVMKTTRELALEGFMHFIGTHEGKAKDYPDFVEARVAAFERLQQLAIMEKAFGYERVARWLDETVKKAEAQIAEEAANAARS